VYAASRDAVARARDGGGPTLIECRTMRMRGHSEADTFGYVPADVLREWAARDPIDVFERRLTDSGVLTPEADAAMRSRIAREVDEGLEWAEASPEPAPSSVADGVFASE
jgi:TPP-dependent pyruvate/acetoin dehydrogenase alpha subunit